MENDQTCATPNGYQDTAETSGKGGAYAGERATEREKGQGVGVLRGWQRREHGEIGDGVVDTGTNTGDDGESNRLRDGRVCFEGGERGCGDDVEDPG